MPSPSLSSVPADTLRRETWRLDVSEAVDLQGAFEIEASLIYPPLAAGAEVTLLVCLPGGFLSRHYFDLEVKGSRRYSFAAAMAQLGHVVLSLDHLGTGGSSRPACEEDGYALGVHEIARANQSALELACARLREGDPLSNRPALRITRSVGVGHSMGSMMTVEQQALGRAHDALLLFSFSTHGTPQFLDDTMSGYANDPERLRKEIGTLIKKTMGSPYPPRAMGASDDRRAAFGIGTAPEEAQEALQQASTNLLAVGGLTSMIPGGFAIAATKIDVPVFMVVGDHDLHDDRHTRDELPNAPRVSTEILEDCWHCHFVANTREQLWSRVSDWLLTFEA